MNSYLTKLRYIFLPFLLCILAVLVGYTALNWLFVIQLDCIPLNDMITQLVAPALIAFIVAVTVLRPAVRRLFFKNDKGSDFMYFVFTLGIGLPAIIAQCYLSTATGKLTTLEHVSAIDSLHKTKYYTLKHYYFHKKDGSAYSQVSTSGKNNQYMDFTLYCVEPILNSEKDTMAGSTHYWLCTEYHEQVSNHWSEDRKQAAFESFVKDSEHKFRLQDYSFSYLERLNHDRDMEYYGHAASQNKWARDGADIFLSRQQGNFADRSGGTFGWIFKSAGIVLAIFALLLLCYRLKTPAELAKVNKRQLAYKARGWRKNYEWAFPHEGSFMLPLLVYANLLLFLAMMFSGLGFGSFDGEDLVKWGSLHKYSVVLKGEWWRFVTYMFVHGGIMHLVNNMASLLFVGILLEPLLGRWRFLAIYIFSGVVAGITSYYWHGQVNTVGASGAVLGMYGCILAFMLMKVTPPGLNKVFFWFASISVGLTLLMGLVGNVDNAAHIGGLISGFIVGLALSEKVKAMAS